MISFVLRPKARGDVSELGKRFGDRFRKDYTSARRTLENLPYGGPPAPLEGHPDMRHILLPRCKHYLFYKYLEKQQVIRIYRFWSNLRGSPVEL